MNGREAQESGLRLKACGSAFSGHSWLVNGIAGEF
jgi:hypothetical protein